MKNLIRIGHVSSVDENRGTVRVIIDDQEDIVTNDLPLLSFEWNPPNIGDSVLCLFLSNGVSSGFCLGPYYLDGNFPRVKDRNIWVKDFRDGTSIQYNKTTQELSLTTVGDIKLNVGGNLTINAKGSITSIAGDANTDISNANTVPVTHHP